MAEKVRLSLQMSKDAYNELEQVEQESGLNKGEIFRRALALWKVARQSAKKNYHLGTAKDPEKLDQEFVGF
jgi:hypothetical protein